MRTQTGTAVERKERKGRTGDARPPGGVPSEPAGAPRRGEDTADGTPHPAPAFPAILPATVSYGQLCVKKMTASSLQRPPCLSVSAARGESTALNATTVRCAEAAQSTPEGDCNMFPFKERKVNANLRTSGRDEISKDRRDACLNCII